MALITLQPTANQTPDAGQGGLAVTGPSNTGHSSTSAVASEGSSQSKTCRWSSFPAGPGGAVAVTLKVTHTSSGTLLGGAPSNLFRLQYSVNGGGAWTNIVERSDYTSSQGPTTASVTLSTAQDLTQVQVRDLLFAATGVGETATAVVTISDIQIEALMQDGMIMLL